MSVSRMVAVFVAPRRMGNAEPHSGQRSPPLWARRSYPHFTHNPLRNRVVARHARNAPIEPIAIHAAVARKGTSLSPSRVVLIGCSGPSESPRIASRPTAPNAIGIQHTNAARAGLEISCHHALIAEGD